MDRLDRPRPGVADDSSIYLRDYRWASVEVQLLRDGEWFYGRRRRNRATALVEVDDMKAEQPARGGVLLPAES